MNDDQIVLHCHVSTSNSDKNELEPCIYGVKENIGCWPLRAPFDAGYSSFSNEELLKKLGILSYIPHQDFFKTKKEDWANKNNFKYDKEKDQYTCAMNEPLIYSRKKRYSGYDYKVYKGKTCDICPLRAACTPASHRTVSREKRQDTMDDTTQRLKTEEGKALFSKRKHKVEPVFGHFRQNLGYNYFLLRGEGKVEAELTIMCTAFDMMKVALKWVVFLIFSLFSPLGECKRA